MRTILFVLALVSLLVAGGQLLLGQTNAEFLIAAVFWLAFIVALAAVFIINAIEDVKHHVADTSELLYNLPTRMGAKEGG